MSKILNINKMKNHSILFLRWLCITTT
jgi:hypothetical protein